MRLFQVSGISRGGWGTGISDTGLSVVSIISPDGKANGHFIKSPLVNIHDARLPKYFGRPKVGRIFTTQSQKNTFWTVPIKASFQWNF